MIISPQTLRGIFVGFNTLFNKAFEDEKPLYEQIATVTPSTTDSETYAWLGDIPGMREWIGDREIQNLAASDYTIKNKDFELTVGVDRNAVEDDKIGLYSPSIQMLGQAAAMHPDELVFGLLKDGFSSKCFDGQAFFSSDHTIGKKKVSNKSTAKLSLDAYVAARSAMMSLTNGKGRPLNLVPNLLGRPSRSGERGTGYPDRGLHQWHQEHHAGHGKASGRAPACRKRLRLVSALCQPAHQAHDLSAAQEGKVCFQDRRDRRQCLHEQAVYLWRGQPRERGLRLLADGLRQRWHRLFLIRHPSRKEGPE